MRELEKFPEKFWNDEITDAEWIAWLKLHKEYFEFDDWRI